MRTTGIIGGGKASRSGFPVELSDLDYKRLQRLKKKGEPDSQLVQRLLDEELHRRGQ